VSQSVLIFPNLTILVPLLFTILSLVFYYLGKLHVLFSGFLRFKGDFVHGQNTVIELLNQRVDGHCMSSISDWLTKWGEEWLITRISAGNETPRLQLSWLNILSKSMSDSALASVFSSLFAWSITQVKHTNTCKTEGAETTNKTDNKETLCGTACETPVGVWHTNHTKSLKIAIFPDSFSTEKVTRANIF